MTPCRTTFCSHLSRFSTAKLIIKPIAIFITTALVLNAIAPTLAYAATHLQGDQVDANALVRDAYIAVTYRDGNDRESMARGWIDAIGETAFTIRSGGSKGKTTIAYAKVLSIVMSEESSVPAKQMNEVDRFIRNMKAREIAQARQQAKAERLEGETVKVMARGQIAPAEITTGWYAHVLYTSEGTKESATGWIAFKDSEHIEVHNRPGQRFGKIWEIAYSDIDTLVVTKDRRAIGEWKNLRQAVQRFKTNAKVRFKAPSLTEKRIVGDVVKMTQDTLLVRAGRTFLQVPISSITNFEVSIGQRGNTGKGFKIGIGVGLVVLIPVAIEDSRYGGELQGYATAYTMLFIFTPIVVLSTLIGASTKSDKWAEVSPQRLNLSIAPTPEKGLRAALTFNF